MCDYNSLKYFVCVCVCHTQKNIIWKTCSPIKEADMKIILCTRVCVCACVPFLSGVLFLHIFHSISSVDCTAMKLHVTVLIPLHVTHI